MKFGTGSNAERTQKYGGSKYKMTYIRPNIYINKQTSPIFNCVTPVSVSLATLARQLVMCFSTTIHSSTSDVLQHKWRASHCAQVIHTKKLITKSVYKSNNEATLIQFA